MYSAILPDTGLKGRLYSEIRANDVAGLVSKIYKEPGKLDMV